jgi:hypothetical protein
LTETESPKTVTIDGEDYLIDSFPEEAMAALNQIYQITRDIEVQKIQVRNLEYAKQYLVDYLSQNKDKFKKA